MLLLWCDTHLAPLAMHAGHMARDPRPLLPPQVERSQAQAFADKFGIPYVETSAKNGTNVENVFTELSNKIMKDVKDKEGGGAAGAQPEMIQVHACPWMSPRIYPHIASNVPLTRPRALMLLTSHGLTHHSFSSDIVEYTAHGDHTSLSLW